MAQRPQHPCPTLGSQTMSDVNVSIRRWRDAMGSQESISADRLNELQDHLESELRNVPAQDLTDEERVLVAARCIGRPKNLEREFYDSDPSYVWRRRVLWMVVGVFVLAKLPAILMSLLTPLAFLALSPAIRIPSYLISWGMAVGIIAIWGGGFYLVMRLMRGKPKWRGLLSWVGTHPGVTIGLFLIALFASELISASTRIWLAPSAHPNDLGHLAIFQTFALAATGLVIPITLGVIAWACVRRPRIA